MPKQKPRRCLRTLVALSASCGVALATIHTPHCETSYLLDECNFQLDGACEVTDYAENALCGAGEDCYDCDPCRQYNYDCDGCGRADECVWCPGDGLCSSVALEASFWNKHNKQSACDSVEDWQISCHAGSDNGGTETSTYNSTSNSTTNYYSDPLYESMDWMYDLLHLKPVWDMGYTGAGVHVRINDDGVDPAHPELGDRFREDLSCRQYLTQPLDDDSPGFFNPGDHGTAQASIIAAEANNNVCGVGVAPGATISSCYMGDKDTDEQDAETLSTHLESVDISSNSWGPFPCRGVRAETQAGFDDFLGDDDAWYDDDGGGFWDDDGGKRRKRRRQLQVECPFDPNHPSTPCGACSVDMLDIWCERGIVDYCSNHYENDPVACSSYLDLYVDCSYHVLSPLLDEVFAKAVVEGRNGLGTIFVFAGGNDYTYGVDVNFDGLVNSRYTVSVGATGKDGLHASYSTTGAALLVSAPGGDDEYVSNFIVAKYGGGCTEAGSGTSYSCPIVSGVVALILEANPFLGWRDVQGIIVSSSTKTDAADESWTTNGAGHSHSYKYGFGLVNAEASVIAALSWQNFGPEQQIMLESGSLQLPITNNRSMTTTSVLTVSDREDFVVETVVLYLDVRHGSRGDLLVELRSPSGTVSVLHPSKRPEDTALGEDERWKLTTVRNYFENPSGNWTLTIIDEDPEKLTGCINGPYENEVVEDRTTIFLDCNQIETVYEDCKNGKVLNPAVFDEVDEENGTTAAEACCACGGGTPFPDDVLRGWRMIVYGHTLEGNATNVIGHDDSAKEANATFSLENATKVSRDGS